MVEPIPQARAASRRPRTMAEGEWGAHICCQLCPCAKQLAPVMASFLTLEPELDNVRAAARFMVV